MAKATDIEIQERIDTVLEMYIKGCSRNYILRYCSEEFKISERQVEEYLSRAYKKIKELNTDEEQKKLLDLAISQMNDLYVKNYTIQDFRECRSLIESRAKLLGHFEKDNKQKTPFIEDLKVQIIPPDAEGDDSI